MEKIKEIIKNKLENHTFQDNTIASQTALRFILNSILKDVSISKVETTGIIVNQIGFVVTMIEDSNEKFLVGHYDLIRSGVFY